MSYIGVQPTAGQYRQLDDISGSFNGATVTFTTSVGGLNVTAGSAEQLLVSLGGVIQNPGADYSVSTNSITFSTAPGSGLDFFAVLMGDAINVGTPADGSVTSVKLASDLTVDLASGTVSAPSLTFDANTGLYSPGADQVAISTNGLQRLVVNSGGITSTNGGVFQGDVSSYATNGLALTFNSNNSEIRACRSGGNYSSMLFYTQGANSSGVQQERMRLTSEGLLGIGTTTPSVPLHVVGGNARIDGGATGSVAIIGTSGTPSDGISLQSTYTGSGSYGPLMFFTSGDEKARIDSSGRLLVGTSSSPTGGDAQYAKLVVKGYVGDNTGYAPIALMSGTNGSSLASGDGLGRIEFCAADSASFAQITAFVDGTPGSNDYPGRLVFSTTADGASSPTERMRIKENGQVLISGSTTTSAVYAFQANNSGSNALFALRNDGYINTGSQALSPYNNTTASAANMYVFSDGGLYRSTSSIRFKTDVETLQPQYADALLNCRPVWYRSLCANDNKDWGYWGFIAEEVAAIDPRLVFWKTHETEKDEDGNTAQVELEEPIAEGVQYDRFVPHLLNLIKRQGEAIAELQAEVAALKGA